MCDIFGCVPTETVSTFGCKLIGGDGDNCQSLLDELNRRPSKSPSVTKSGMCHHGICHACYPSTLPTHNECKLSYFTPDIHTDSIPSVDCSSPPNKPNRTPCSRGLCFDGNCKPYSELTNAKHFNGEKCQKTKEFPKIRYYFEGICRECDESTPNKLVGVENCSSHPGLSTWRPSRKSCAEPDICVYTPPPTPPIQSGDQDEKAPH